MWNWKLYKWSLKWKNIRPTYIYLKTKIDFFVLKPYILTSFTSISHILLILKIIPVIFVTLYASKKGLKNLFNGQRLLIDAEKVIKRRRFFTSLSPYHIKITICSSLNKHTPNFLSHIFYRKTNSTILYKNNFFTFSNNILLYVYYAIEHGFLLFREL